MKKSVKIMLLSAALAAGLSVTAQSVVGAEPTLTKSQLKALIVSAKTPADHQKLADHYMAEAARLEADAAEHTEMAVTYKSIPKGFTMADHCTAWARIDREAEAQAKKMAAEHEAMAKSTK